MSDWQDIATAPKDGTKIRIMSVDGVDGKPMFEGDANWRGEPKEALYSPLTGDCFAPARTLTGWMRADSPYLVPGAIAGWMHLPPPPAKEPT